MWWARKKNFESRTPVDSSGLRDILKEHFGDQVLWRANDPWHGPINGEQVQQIWKQLRKDEFRRGIQAYQAHKHDCDDKLHWLWNYHSHIWWLKHCLTKDVTRGTGSFHYKTRTGNFHYAVWALTPDYRIKTYNYGNGYRDLVEFEMASEEKSSTDWAY